MKVAAAIVILAGAVVLFGMPYLRGHVHTKDGRVVEVINDDLEVDAYVTTASTGAAHEHTHVTLGDGEEEDGLARCVGSSGDDCGTTSAMSTTAATRDDETGSILPEGWRVGYSYIPSGHDVGTSEAMTLRAALDKCMGELAAAGCIGFTFQYEHEKVTATQILTQEQRYAQMLTPVPLTGADAKLLGMDLDTTVVTAHFKSEGATISPYGNGWATFVSPAWKHPGEGLTLYNDAYVDISPQAVLEALGNSTAFGSKIEVVHENPHVVVIDDFFTSEEVDFLIAMGEEMGFGQSQVLMYDNPNLEATTNYRTSWTAHCNDECLEDPMIITIQSRIAAATQTNIDNSEPLQFTRYHPGQEFRVHSDAIERHLASPAGARIFTGFAYLQEPESGGHTAFPNLGASVAPKRGRIVFWSNVLEDSDDAESYLTHHAGEPVTEGVKLGLNAWIHRASYKIAYAAGLG